MLTKQNNNMLKIRRSKETDGLNRIKEYIRSGDEHTSPYIIGDVVKGGGHVEVNCYLNKNNLEEGIKLLFTNPDYDTVQIAIIAVKKYDSNLEKLANILPKSSFRSEIEKRVKQELNIE